MSKKIQQKLITFRKKTIAIAELEELISRLVHSYEDFAKEIMALEQAGFLKMIKSTGRNQRVPSLAYQYRINKNLLNKAYHRELQHYRLTLDDAIDIDSYFNLSASIWEQDLPYLEKIHTYLQEYGYPQEAVPAPERSFELVGDEKWLIEGKGSDVLHRIKLWDDLQIMPVSDPLMFAINPRLLANSEQLHLIVENKTTYQALLPVLMNTNFSTLIYGSGNKIPKSIENFSNQYPVKATHTFFYFGDLDRSGITIWHSLTRREHVYPALPFYRACLKRTRAYGKINQRPNEEALNAFLTYFSNDEQLIIRELLSAGAYYPQEVLKTKELQCIWEESMWSI